MKKVLLSLAAVAAVAVAVPATAQPYGAAYGYYKNQNNHRPAAASINQREATIARKIDAAYRRGQLSRAEATRLMAELRSSERIEQAYRRNGVNWRERDALNLRITRLQQRLQHVRDDGYVQYGYGYGARW